MSWDMITNAESINHSQNLCCSPKHRKVMALQEERQAGPIRLTSNAEIPSAVGHKLPEGF